MIRNSFFWFTDGLSWFDRLRLLYYWLSPRFFGHRPGPPVQICTRFRGGRPIYVRSASTDVRVLRNIFNRADYFLPEDLTGKISSVVDLGAYTGISTLYFANRYPNARIIAVEPDDSNYTCLQRNIQTLAGADRVTTLKACVSDKRGTARFSVDGPNWARSICDQGEVEISCFTLTDLVEEYGLERVDLLKMDIEGAEKQVFNSAKEWLGRVGWILMEVHFAAMPLSELVTTLASYGRRAFFKVRQPSVHWAEIDGEQCLRLQRSATMLDVLIPPAEDSKRLSEAAPRT